MKRRDLFFAARPKHWVKNLFVFLPLIFGQKLFVYPYNVRTLVVFALFSLAASGTYLLNDLIDLGADRFHRTKRLRPLAAGHISRSSAAWTCAAVPPGGRDRTFGVSHRKALRQGLLGLLKRIS